MLTFPDPNVETEYTDPNGVDWIFDGTGWVKQCDCPDGGGGGGGVPDWEKVHLLVNGELDDGNIDLASWDVTGKSTLAKVNGTSQVAHAQAKHGLGSIRNISGYISLGKQDVGNESWTFEFWMRPDLDDTNLLMIAGKWTNNSTDGRAWQLNYRGDASAQLELMHSPAGSSFSRLPVTRPLTRNVWQHFAVVYDFDSKTFRLFVDGTLTIEMTNCEPIDPIDRDWYIGSVANTSAYFRAWWDDIRLTIGEALYVADFTPPGELPTSRIAASSDYVSRPWTDDSLQEDSNDVDLS